MVISPILRATAVENGAIDVRPFRWPLQAMGTSYAPPSQYPRGIPFG
jgi:hypothetical protein